MAGLEERDNRSLLQGVVGIVIFIEEVAVTREVEGRRVERWGIGIARIGVTHFARSTLRLAAVGRGGELPCLRRVDRLECPIEGEKDLWAASPTERVEAFRVKRVGSRGGLVWPGEVGGR
jgi:hypothetical protein